MSKQSYLKRKKSAISGINITPFVDVVLVLLIIFMITAPLMYSGIKLELPKTKKVNSLSMTSAQVVLSMSATGEFYIGKTKFLEDELVPKIKADLEKNNTEILFLRAHKRLEYGQVAKLMGFLKRGGIVKIALITEVDDDKI